MPFTLGHLGFGFFLVSIFPSFFNFWAIVFASVLPDLEPLFLVLFKKCFHCPHHAFFHSFLGAILGSFFIALFCFFFKKNLKSIFPVFSSQDFSFLNLYFSSLLAYFFHIFFDSLCHRDVFIFWPLKWQPTFLGKKFYSYLSFFLLSLGFLGILILGHFYDKRRSDKNK